MAGSYLRHPEALVRWGLMGGFLGTSGGLNPVSEMLLFKPGEGVCSACQKAPYDMVGGFSSPSTNGPSF